MTTDARAALAVARLFHETYERLAPDFGYRTREASAKPWDEVPEANRNLMVATVSEVLAALPPCGHEAEIERLIRDLNRAQEAICKPFYPGHSPDCPGREVGR